MNRVGWNMKRNAIKNKAFLKLVGSSLIIATTMVGCSGASNKARPALTAAKADKQAAAFAAVAEKALAKRDFAAALAAAEGAVAARPDNATYRTLLGRAYIANGRFASAEAALDDAMTLGNSDPRTIISLALAKTAQNKAVEARGLLGEYIDVLPAADYGLAIALAGDAREGVRVLSHAIHEPSAGAKERQNLAYAYALSGHWREARLMAAQDMAPLAAAQRIALWAQTAEPGAEAVRVAALLGVAPRADDAGLPVRLALAPAPAGEPIEMAEAPLVEMLPIGDVPSEAAPVAVAAMDRGFVVEREDAPAVAAPVIRAPEGPARQPVLAEMPRVVRDVVKPMIQKVALIKPVEGAAASPWVVQLGAYDSAAIAKERWQRMTQSHQNLATFPVITSMATVNGKTFHRLAVSGFDSRASADQMCRTIKAQKGQCFVRAGEPAAKTERWVAAKGKQFASR